MALGNTGEKISGENITNNPIYLRSKLAYEFAAKECYGTVLELGTGTGYGITNLAPKVDFLLTMDKDKVDVDRLSSEHKNVFFIERRIPLLYGILSESIDCVVCLQFIEHIKDDDLLIKEIFRVLKPGGRCIVSTPNKNMSLSRNPYHYREYTDQEIIAKFSTITNCTVKIFGVTGNAKVQTYYSLNKDSVKKLERYDPFNLRKFLPSNLLKIPFEIANRYNRNKLFKDNPLLVQNITIKDYLISTELTEAFDYILEIQKTKEF